MISRCESVLSRLSSSSSPSPDAMRTMLRAVHKLRDYQNRSLDALAALAAVDAAEAIQYCTSSRVWSRIAAPPFSADETPESAPENVSIVEEAPLAERVRRLLSRQDDLETMAGCRHLLGVMASANALAVVRSLAKEIVSGGKTRVLQVARALPDLFIPLLVELVSNQAERMDDALLTAVNDMLSEQYASSDPAVARGLQRALELARQS